MKKSIVFSFCFLLFFLTASSAAAFAASDSVSDAPVSCGLSVLAEENAMAMAGMRGSDIRFDSDDFARALNLSSVRSVTVTELPPIEEGELTVGTTVVNKGQTISAASLSLLRYRAKNDGVSTSSFRFSLPSSGYDVPCLLYLLDAPNHAPTLSHVSELSVNVSTHKGVTLYGTLPAYDPDGDAYRIEIVSYPKEGLLHLLDRQTGAYTYTPGKGYTGKDSFTYVARDQYGHYSASQTVSLDVHKPSTSAVYTDMLASPDYNAALYMTEAGVMSGTQVGTNLFFYPEETVSRAEFVVMAMNALGIRDLQEASTTVFADDGDIADRAKPYIATAYELGYVKGILRDGVLCFEPNRPITRAEAAVVVSRLVDLAAPTVTPAFADASAIPAYAAPAMHALTDVGAFRTENGQLSPTSAMTRGDTARLLCDMCRLSEQD